MCECGLVSLPETRAPVGGRDGVRVGLGGGGGAGEGGAWPEAAPLRVLSRKLSAGLFGFSADALVRRSLFCV